MTTAFMLSAALMLAGALLFVLPPLVARRAGSGSGVDGARASVDVLREHAAEIDADLAAGRIDESRHAQARAELARRVLEDADGPGNAGAGAGDPARHPLRTAWVVGLLLPMAAAGTYRLLGAPEALDPAAVQARASSAAAEHALTREQVQAMVERLAGRLREQPDDLDGWVMLARSRAALGQYPQAVDAYARASALRPDDAQLLADHADTLAMVRGRRLAGEPEALVLRALAVDPRHPKALALAGTAAFEQGDYPRAIGHWQALLAAAPPGSEMARSVEGSIADAQRRAAGAPPQAMRAQAPPGGARVAAPPAAAGRPDPVAAGGSAIDGEIALAPELADRVGPGDTVYVVARPADGGRVPVAVLRLAVGTWPMRFRLDDTASMNSALPLSGAGRVMVVARVSKSGEPSARAGDLEGSAGPVAPGGTGVAIRVSRIVP